MVMFQAVNILSGTKTPADADGRCGPQVQECWEFEHPRRDAVVNKLGIPLDPIRFLRSERLLATGLPFTNSHNTRSAKLRFYIPHAGILQCVDCLRTFGNNLSESMYARVPVGLQDTSKQSCTAALG